MASRQSRLREKQIAVLGRQSGAESTFPLLCFHMPILGGRRNVVGFWRWKEASCEVVVMVEYVGVFITACILYMYLLLPFVSDVRILFLEQHGRERIGGRRCDDGRVRKVDADGSTEFVAAVGACAS